MNNYNGILAAIANIKLKKGKTQTLYATLNDPNDSDNPYDLSVFDSLRAACKRNPNDTEELWFFVPTYTGPTNNIMVLPFTETETDLVPGGYNWDVIGLIGTEETPIIEGQYIISTSVQ